MWNLLVFALLGLLTGAASRLLYPGREPRRVLGSMALGMAGALCGGMLSWIYWPSVDGQFQAGNLVTSLLGALMVLVLVAGVSYAWRPLAPYGPLAMLTGPVLVVATLLPPPQVHSPSEPPAHSEQAAVLEGEVSIGPAQLDCEQQKCREVHVQLDAIVQQLGTGSLTLEQAITLAEAHIRVGYPRLWRSWKPPSAATRHGKPSPTTSFGERSRPGVHQPPTRRRLPHCATTARSFRRMSEPSLILRTPARLRRRGSPETRNRRAPVAGGTAARLVERATYRAVLGKKQPVQAGG
ncbi:MAG TPA: hypothetical protein VFA18_02700 [Gemmataceae bacterium]|nr:hypothetical protein [Gemmataceae bacterium]